MKLKVINDITFVNSEHCVSISKEDVTIKLVGEKAYGLSCIPKNWTLPYIVISSDFINTKSFDKWFSNILIAVNTIISSDENENIIIRSSASNEGLIERGQLFSIPCIIKDLKDTLLEYIKKIKKDRSDNEISLIIQKFLNTSCSLGHLSNERRVSENKRDWTGEFENEQKLSEKYFKIALRNWREEINYSTYLNVNLHCVSKEAIREVLKIPATWATKNLLRIHYEWIWDGYFVFIVQADEENELIGDDPNKIQLKDNFLKDFKPKCLNNLNTDFSNKYSKIRNIFIYKELNLPIAPLYILEDKEILKDISQNIFKDELLEDLEYMIRNPLMIRMDMNVCKEEKQLLPREEFRDINILRLWLMEQALTYKEKIIDKNVDIAFLFHNFVPAVSSAFAYAIPGKRKVLIEALWGLPEGLYYNSHDTYAVDTKCLDISTMNKNNFIIDKRLNYKKYYVTSDENGSWNTKILKPPYDWKDSITNEEWLKEIAFNSRKIAEKEDKPISIMWFVDVPEIICPNRIFPWHHEELDEKTLDRSKKSRRKTTFDKVFIINTEEHLEELKSELIKQTGLIKKINIRPMEDNLLRKKKLLDEIGSLAQEINAVIILEGSILSHAYYQLVKTGAQVEIYHPFEDFGDKQEFNKLVRDKIPENIENGGEIVNIAKLEKDSIIRALKDKLIEESFEVFDSVDDLELLSELADVYEVIDGLLYHLGIKKEELIEKQIKKFNKVGGFKEGKVLLDTENPLSIDTKNNNLFSNLDNILTEINYDSLPNKDISNRYKDSQKLINNEKHISRIKVPVLLSNWKTQLFELELGNQKKVGISLSCSREGIFSQLELIINEEKEKIKQLEIKFE